MHFQGSKFQEDSMKSKSLPPAPLATWFSFWKGPVFPIEVISQIPEQMWMYILPSIVFCTYYKHCSSFCFLPKNDPSFSGCVVLLCLNHTFPFSHLIPNDEDVNLTSEDRTPTPFSGLFFLSLWDLQSSMAARQRNGNCDWVQETKPSPHCLHLCCVSKDMSHPLWASFASSARCNPKASLPGEGWGVLWRVLCLLQAWSQGALIHWFTNSFIHSVTYLQILSPFMYSLIYSLINTLIHSFIHLLSHPYTCLVTHSTVYSLIH